MSVAGWRYLSFIVVTALAAALMLYGVSGWGWFVLMAFLVGLASF